MQSVVEAILMMPKRVGARGARLFSASTKQMILYISALCRVPLVVAQVSLQYFEGNGYGL